MDIYPIKAEERTTRRLILRKITPEIIDFVYEELSLSEQIVFLGLNSVEELEIEKSNYDQGLCTDNKSFLYFQLLDPSDRKIIGWCGFHTWYLDHARAEIGYGLYREEAKGKGLMTEAIAPIIAHGFMEMKLNRIEAFIPPKNTPSIKLVEKLNFVREGKLREHYCKNDRAEDSIIYSILRKEYENI